MGSLTAMAYEPTEQVHTIYWQAVMRATYSKGNVKLKKGKKVVVVDRNYRGGKSGVRVGDKTVRVPNGYLSFVKDLCTGAQGDYSKETKLWYVNERRNLTSPTKVLIWVSLDKQRVNVFNGSKGNWELVKVMPCSTGKVDSPSKAGLHRCDFVTKVFRNCVYYVEYAGSGIHKWARSDYKDIKKIGKHTVSQSCIRLRTHHAKWLYKHTPVKTTILVW